jgi:hypothetical protein
VILLGALLLWGSSLSGVDLRKMTDLGLITVLPSAYYGAVGALVVSICVMIRHAQRHQTLLILHVAALILIFHGTPVLLYGTLRYSWAWKHVGIVDFIQRYGAVNPSSLSIYHNWPGFFTLSAFLDSAAGLKDPLGYAAWAPVFFNLLNMGILLLIFQSLTKDQRLVWLSMLLFYLASWVGQDYYSPQAWTYSAHLAVMGICLRWFRETSVPDKASLRRWLVFGWVVNLYHWLIKHGPSADLEDSRSTPLRRVGLMVIAIALVLAICTTHQLTPIMSLASLGALVVFRQCRERYFPILVALLTMAWLFYSADHYLGMVIESTLETLREPMGSVQLIDLAVTSDGQRTVAVVGRILTLSIWGVGLLGVLTQLRRGQWDLAPILLAFMPFGVMVTNSYGGEMIFRAYMFALPWMAFLGVSIFFPTPRAGQHWLWTGVIIGICGLLTVGFFFPYYGKENQFYFSPGVVAAGHYLADHAPENTLLIEGTRNYPSRFRNYEFITYVALSREPEESQQKVLRDPVTVLATWMDNSRYAASYLIITSSQKVEVDMTGAMPPGSLEYIERVLLASPKFKPIFQNEDAVIFVLADAPLVDAAEDSELGKADGVGEPRKMTLQ